VNLYPAIRSHMGSWEYYVVKMSARELSENVKFGSEVYEDRTLDEAIQRALNETRIKKDIITYLKRQPDRFFSSIVVAALGGEPKFYPVEITDDPQFAVFRDDERLNETFGVLKFDGTQNYYALDGQHRLAAIKTLLDKQNELSEGAPEDFHKDELSVIVVVPRTGETPQGFMQKYRRLFSNLNRYAKPTDQDTNIIMDEDDAFAILTRRLITDHEFFKSPGRQKESHRVQTKGKNLKEGQSYFTSLQTLYEMNTSLLASRDRENKGWDSSGEGTDRSTFKRFRPDEDYLESLFDELALYWDGLLRAVPTLRNEPATMRVHSLAPEEETDKRTDHLLFWPIGQEMLAKIAREALDNRLPDPGKPTSAGVSEALSRLGQLEWRLHRPPWRYFLLTEQEPGKWKMRSEDRKEAIRIGERIQLWMLGIDELDQPEVQDLRMHWAARLIPNQPDDREEEMWTEVEKKKAELSKQTKSPAPTVGQPTH
jgi:DNA sulfur modification protein DndB